MRTFLPAPPRKTPQRAATTHKSTVPRAEAAAAPNRTGMPDALKAGIETLSGLSMDRVRVHYDSPLPAPLAARAFARGTDIHLAPGQERHLPHEAWHVVQQQQRRVPVTGQVEDTPVNGDAALEREADAMGRQAEAEGGLGAMARQRTAERGAPARSHAGKLGTGAPASRAETGLGPASTMPVQLKKFDEGGGVRWFREIYFDTDRPEDFRAKVKAYAAAGRFDVLRTMLKELSGPSNDAAAFRAASVIRWYLTKSSADASSKDAWRLFIDESQHPETTGRDSKRSAALSFDSDQSPGYYNMMQSIFETEILDESKRDRRVNFDVYDQYHRRLTQGAKAKTDEGGFRNVPHELSGRDVQYPMTNSGNPDLEALKELIDEGVAGLDAEKLKVGVNIAFDAGAAILKGAELDQIQAAVPKTPDLTNVQQKLRTGGALSVGDRKQVIQLGFRYWKEAKTTDKNFLTMRAAKRTYSKTNASGGQFSSRFVKVNVGSSGDAQWLVRTDREANQAKPLVNNIFTQMYEKIDDALNNHEKVLAICRAIRALHTAHIYVDANGRLNTMLLLNKLLGEIGFAPISLADTSVFGGRMTAEDLAGLVEARLPEPEET